MEALKSNDTPKQVSGSLNLDDFIDDYPEAVKPRPFYYRGIKYNSYKEFKDEQRG